MAVTADVVAGVRQKMRDFPKMFQTDVQGDGIAQIFEFPVIDVEATTLNVVGLSAGGTQSQQTDTIVLNGTTPVQLSKPRLYSRSFGVFDPATGSYYISPIDNPSAPDYIVTPVWPDGYDQDQYVIGYATIERTANSAIPDGATVSVTYAYGFTSPDGVTLLPGIDFTLDAHHGMMMLMGHVLATDESLNVFGTHYEWFLDSDIESESGWFIDSLESYSPQQYDFDDLAVADPKFELTVRGVLLGCLWSLLIETSLDIDVRNPEGVDIPTSQRYAHLQSLIDLWTARYQDLQSKLNIGVDAISIWTLRRVSYTTGRLVPIYVEQEFDDTATPQRMYPPIDMTQGPTATPQTAEELPPDLAPQPLT